MSFVDFYRCYDYQLISRLCYFTCCDTMSILTLLFPLVCELNEIVKFHTFIRDYPPALPQLLSTSAAKLLITVAVTRFKFQLASMVRKNASP